jgi:predicted Co/Zn/Cd cation transporter (cation efflux family)
MIEMHTIDWVLAAVIPTAVVVGFIAYHCGKLDGSMDTYREYLGDDIDE